MTIIGLARKMLSTSGRGFHIHGSRPRLHPSFFVFTLLLSLLPPAMLYRAGTSHGALFTPGFDDKPWMAIAIACFCVEMLSVSGAAWLARELALVNGGYMSRHDAWALAIVSRIPLWLSFLSLLAPNLPLILAMVLLGHVAECALIVHGFATICRPCEELTSIVVTQTVVGTELVVKVLLLLLIMLTT